MAGHEHEMACADRRGRLRASDTDREHVVDTLKAAYVHGLVTKDEFDIRVSQALAARARGELAAITADIPAGLAAAPPSLSPARPRARAPRATSGTARTRAITATAVIAGLAMAASVLVSPAAGGLPLAGLLMLVGTGSGLVSLVLVGLQLRSQRGRSGGELPPRRGLDTGSQAADRAVRGTPAEPLPRASKPQRRSNADAARRQTLRPLGSS